MATSPVTSRSFILPSLQPQAKLQNSYRVVPDEWIKSVQRRAGIEGSLGTLISSGGCTQDPQFAPLPQMSGVKEVTGEEDQ
jgi:hypothetical protein